MRTSTTALRHLLWSLCQNTQWAYAVFWKLKHGNHATLTWEDAYLDETKAGVIVENTLHDGLLSVKPGVISFGCARDAWNGSSAGYPIEVIVASMSCQLYSLGEGIIGKVAQTGNHRWIFAAEFNSESSPECSENWQLQFAVGVKTILLVPVIPHGVVQLGSLDLVMEDSTLVIRIKDLFSTLHHISGTCSSFAPSVDCLNPFSPFAMPLVGSLSVSSALTGDLLNPIQIQQLPTISPIQDNVRTSQDVMGHALGTNTRLCKHDNLWNAEYSDLWIDPTEELSLLNGSMYLDKIFEGDMPFTDAELGSISHSQYVNHGLTSEQITLSNSFQKDAEHGGYGLPYVRDWTNQEFGGELADINDISVNLPIDSEQHKILGLGFRNEYDDCVITTTLQKDDKLKRSTAICHTAAGPTLNGLLVEESNAWLAKEGDADHLLDVLLADLQYPNDDSFEAFKCIKSCSNSSEEYMDSYLTHCKNEHRVFNFGVSSPSNHERLSFVSENEGSTSSPTDILSKNISMLENKKQNNRITCDDKNNRGLKSSQNHKRSSRSHKPRPRDRQLIQNRVKELRELIPDASKCSIDALLHRTVKHMLFLQSISNQAEKLRNSTVPKVACEDWNLKISQSRPNGASWTYQLRSQPEICPLKVENLDQPGQILIEMLCEEYELFLEIAQVIRHLDLIILKGVLSSRSDMLWAHFIVEASRGFHHTHILLPLMQLLQRNQQLLIV